MLWEANNRHKTKQVYGQFLNIKNIQIKKENVTDQDITLSDAFHRIVIVHVNQWKDWTQDHNEENAVYTEKTQ